MVIQCKNLISLYILPDQRRVNLLVGYKLKMKSEFKGRENLISNKSSAEPHISRDQFLLARRSISKTAYLVSLDYI